MWPSLVTLLVIAPAFGLCQDENAVVVHLPSLGHIKGRTIKTLGNLGQEQRTFYNFRNIPFAQSVSGTHRFSEPKAWNTLLGTETNPYDATRSGPLCPQMGLDQELFDHYLPMEVEGALRELLNDLIGSWSGLIDLETIIRLIEALLEVPLYGETVEDAIRDLLDVDVSVDEDCLHLAVSTPDLNPDKPLPVMVFVYGGGYKAGTQLKMGYERLGDVNDVVLVAINYRVGPLGFMCLPDERAAGNMGLLDAVLGLQWVQDNVAHFGGDPERVTIFGQSAGGASVTHLMLSPIAKGLFHQVIAQSGAAVGPWAFENAQKHEYHTRRWASMLNCDKPDVGEMIECLKVLPVAELTSSAGNYSNWDQKAAGMGFGGINPCSQTHGAQKFWSEGQTPLKTLKTGNYTPVPIFAGACANDGTLVLSESYEAYIQPEGFDQDEAYLRYNILELMFDTVNMDLGYAFKDYVEEAYFWPFEIGNFQAMTRGLKDLGGMLLLKAPTYKMVEDNSRYADSYFYSLEAGTQNKKSLYNTMFLGYTKDTLPFYSNVGGSHADDLLYLFNLNLPIVLCDLQTFLVGLSSAWLQCVLEVGIVGATNCVTDPQGKFKQDYGECIFGTLSEAEAKTSDAMVRAWTNFAIYGTPTPSNEESLPTLDPWSYPDPKFIRFGTSEDQPALIDTDYRKTFSSKGWE